MRLVHLLMLRVSEYTITKANHFIRGQHITFCLDDGSYVTSPNVSYHVSPRVTGVLIDVRSAKNDKYGAGHRFYFARNTVFSSQCISTVLLVYNCGGYLTLYNSTKSKENGSLPTSRSTLRWRHIVESAERALVIANVLNHSMSQLSQLKGYFNAARYTPMVEAANLSINNN
jgi:hypothetical protein